MLHAIIIVTIQPDGSRVNKAFSGVCLYVCVSVCPRDRTKTVENIITKLCTGILHHEQGRIQGVSGGHPPSLAQCTKMRHFREKKFKKNPNPIFLAPCSPTLDPPLITSPRPSIIIRSKGQSSRSQVTKCIKAIECPFSSYNSTYSSDYNFA